MRASRTTQGIVTAAVGGVVLVLDAQLGLGLGDAIRGALEALVIAGLGWAGHGLQRRIPRGDYAEGPVPTTSTEVLPDSDRPPRAMP